MSGSLFLLVIDWVMRKTDDNRRMGIRWKFSSVLEDMEFANDLVLVSSKFTDIQNHEAQEHSWESGAEIELQKMQDYEDEYEV